MNDESTVTQSYEDDPSLSSVVSKDTRYRFDLNRKTHRLRVPIAEESEERMVVYIEPVE